MAAKSHKALSSKLRMNKDKKSERIRVFGYAANQLALPPPRPLRRPHVLAARRPHVAPRWRPRRETPAWAALRGSAGQTAGEIPVSCQTTPGVLPSPRV